MQTFYSLAVCKACIGEIKTKNLPLLFSTADVVKALCNRKLLSFRMPYPGFPDRLSGKTGT